jgi:hypothetical protein
MCRASENEMSAATGITAPIGSIKLALSQQSNTDYMLMAQGSESQHYAAHYALVFETLTMLWMEVVLRSSSKLIPWALNC